MLASEVADVLVLNAALDRFASASRVSEEQAVAWAAVIRHSAGAMTPDEARALIIEFYAEAGESLTPYALVDLWRRRRRMLPDQIAADVRSAQARGLIARSWSQRDALPDEVAARLAALRSAGQAQAAEIAARPPGTNALPQLVSKRVPA